MKESSAQRSISILEYFLAVVAVVAGTRTALGPSLDAASPLAFIFGGEFAAIIYGALIVLSGLFLAFSKITKKRKLHRHALMAVYLAIILEGFVEFALFGLSLGLLDEATLGLITAWLWIRWKFKTEYLSPKQVGVLRNEARKLNGHNH